MSLTTTRHLTIRSGCAASPVSTAGWHAGPFQILVGWVHSVFQLINSETSSSSKRTT
jgi:hypothetical protein